MDNENIFQELEKVLKETIDVDIKKILLECGFDCKLAVSSLDKEGIKEIEQYANEDRSVLKDTSYENMKTFVFKPGHKLSILQLANEAKNILKAKVDGRMEQYNDFSLILKTFIETAQSNYGRHPKGFRYNDINRYFSIFVYLFCGKSCYETLSANLPIPGVDSIRKFYKKN